ITDSGAGAQIQGNYIGVNKTGTAALGAKVGTGIIVTTTASVISGNVISNKVTGINLGGATNVVQSNIIGLNAAGSAAIGNTYGIFNVGNTNTIGGGAGLGNIVSGNSNTGIYVSAGTNNGIEGNYIGTDINGTTLIANPTFGIYVLAGANGNTIGGNAAGF